MSGVITDANGQEITDNSFQMSDNSESPVFTIYVRALTNYKLTATTDSITTVLARKTGSGAAFQNIAANPIDLTPFANTVVAYDYKVSAADVSVPRNSRAVRFRCTPNP